MAKRRLSVDQAESPSKKRTKSQEQTRLDTFFTSTSPTKPRLAQSSVSSFTTAQPEFDHAEGGGLSRPIVIDADADEIASENAKVNPSARKGKLVQRQPTETRSLQFVSLNVDPVNYCTDEQPWLESGTPYAFLAHTFSTLSQTRSRIIIINSLTNCLRTIIVKDSESLLPSLYLLSNTLAPPYVPVELGLGPSIISRAIQSVSGVTSAALKRLYNSLGDPGDVAASAKSNLRTLIPHPPLTIAYVYGSLLKIARAKGQGATKQKEKLVEKLLLSANGEEIRYLTRTLCQNIRVGAVRTSMLTALARAIVLCQAPRALLSQVEGSNLEYKKSLNPARAKLNGLFAEAEALIKGVFVKHPNYDNIVAVLLDTGLAGLADRVSLTIGIPLHPTLGSPMRSLDEVYDRMEGQPFIAEFKYDGQRAQIHAAVENGQLVEFKIFSRHLEDMTTKYPDVQILTSSILERTPSLKSFIMDAEIVAVDPRTGAIKSFQELSNRAKKDVQLKDVQVSVCLFAFDLMYLNEESLLQKTFRERRALLRSNFMPYTPEGLTSARFAHVESVESEAGRESVENFWLQSIESQTEGLMIKLLDSYMSINDTNDKEGPSRKKPLSATYEPDKRTAAWLKLKKDYVTGIGDSLDLVPIGGWYGNGRKVKWWSPVLMGLYDQSTGRYVAVCKCMSGFTDKFYQDLRDRYTPSDQDEILCSGRPLWDCDFGGFKPDVYFRPQEVWEIRGADITLSPTSVAAKGLVSSFRGLSLRFPRFSKVRDDKTTEQASSPDFLASLWRKQQGSRPEGDDGEDLVDADIFDSSSASEDEFLEEDKL